MTIVGEGLYLVDQATARQQISDTCLFLVKFPEF